MKILCATDLLPKSESAMDRAGMLADHLDAELWFLHVVPRTESDQLLAQDLQRAMGKLKLRVRSPLWRYGAHPNVDVRAGSPARILMETMEELEPDLIVLGRHSHQPIRDFLAGTLAARVLSEHKCPVLIVDSMPWGAYRNIVLALDRTSASVGVVRAAETMVLEDGVRAALVHAYQPPYDGMFASAGIAARTISKCSKVWSDEARTLMRVLLTGASNDVSRYELVIDNATPTAAIKKVVRRLNPELLVLGTRGRGWLGRTLLGSVANRVIATAPCDVLVVPDQTMSLTLRNRRFDRRSLDVITGV